MTAARLHLRRTEPGACTAADLERRFAPDVLRRDLPEARRLVERLRPIYREAA